MTRILLTSATLLLAFQLSAQGIRFDFDSNWAGLLAKAKQENKLLFVDAYTAWCGPCKKLARDVFPDPAAGEFYNAAFVNAQINMEKGEGPVLAERYGVFLYPTLLFLNGDGEVVHRAVGLQSIADFIALGKTAVHPENSLLALERAYKAGNRQPEFLLRLVEVKAGAADPAVSGLAGEYLKTQADWKTPENLDVIFRHVNDPYSEGFRFFAREKALFETKYTAEGVADKTRYAFGQYLENHPGLTLESTERLIGRVFPQDSLREASAYRITYYQRRGEVDSFARAAVAHFDRYPSHDPDQLNEIAWIFYKNVDHRPHLEKALAWAQRSVGIHEAYANLDTVAALHAKLGQKKQAVKAAKRAIELAKAAGEDASATEELLRELEK
jgi:thiol-disulfide isomerase/thioredoxin